MSSYDDLASELPETTHRTIKEFAEAIRAMAILQGLFDPEVDFDWYRICYDVFPGESNVIRSVELSYFDSSAGNKLKILNFVFGNEEEFGEIDYAKLLRDNKEWSL